MDEYGLFRFLSEAWDSSTMSNNRFYTAVDSIQWSEQFYADGEHYFVMGGFVFSTPTLDPFVNSGGIVPSALFSDGSLISFDSSIAFQI